MSTVDREQFGHVRGGYIHGGVGRSVPSNVAAGYAEGRFPTFRSVIARRRAPSSRVAAPTIRPMDGFEYQMMYDCGLMPERFWPREIAKLRARYLADEITLVEFERELDGLLDVRGLERP